MYSLKRNIIMSSILANQSMLLYQSYTTIYPNVGDRNRNRADDNIQWPKNFQHIWERSIEKVENCLAASQQKNNKEMAVIIVHW